MEDFLKKAWGVAVGVKNSILKFEGSAWGSAFGIEKKIYDNTLGKVVTPVLEAENKYVGEPLSKHTVKPILDAEYKYVGKPISDNLITPISDIYGSTAGKIIHPILKEESKVISSLTVPFAEGFKKGKNNIEH